MTTAVVQVSLLIPSHALPPLSYRVPDHLKNDVRIGSAVVAPLSGYGRLGIVVASERDDGRDLKEIRATTAILNLPPSTVKLCAWAADASAQPLQAALRAALPPETNASRYRIIRRPLRLALDGGRGGRPYRVAAIFGLGGSQGC
jgi:primosomal protein N'